MLSATQTRVENYSPEAANRRIQENIAENLKYYATHPAEIDDRLHELDQEWDVERVLEANGAAVGLGGLALGCFVDRRFLLLPALVSGFLLQHALQGWCPPVTLLRANGVRTAREIDQERTGLKALRGDFKDIRREDVTEGLASTVTAAEDIARRTLDAVRS